MQSTYTFLLNGIAYLVIFLGFLSLILALLALVDMALTAILKRIKIYPLLLDFTIDYFRKKHNDK